MEMLNGEGKFVVIILLIVLLFVVLILSQKQRSDDAYESRECEPIEGMYYRNDRGLLWPIVRCNPKGE